MKFVNIISSSRGGKNMFMFHETLQYISIKRICKCYYLEISLRKFVCKYFKFVMGFLKISERFNTAHLQGRV